MKRLIDNLKLFAGEIDRGNYELPNDTALTASSMLLVMAKVMEQVEREGDGAMLEVFAAHLIEFIDAHNEDEEADKNLDNFTRLNNLLEGLNLD